jgi:isopenicillin N synthase-like dioxygenase
MLQLARQGWLSLPLPADLAGTVAELFASSAAFFDLQDHAKARAYPSKSGTEFGYYLVKKEKEYTTFRCRVHTADAAAAQSSLSTSVVSLCDLEHTAARAWRECALLLFRILCDLARWSQLDVSVWDDILDGTLMMPAAEDQMTYTLLRLFRYFPTTGVVAEPHTDLGLLTLCVGDRGGLEVLDRTRSTDDHPVWINAASEAQTQTEPQTQTATILVGQTLKALSNETFNPGIHRVVGNPEGRHSVVFALRHSSRHDVDFGLFGGEGRVRASELWRFIEVGKVNINTVKKRRDAQRADEEVARSALAR